MRHVIIGIFCGLILMSNLAEAQGPPHPDQFQIIYGNRDGTPDTVMPGQVIRVPIWGRTDPDDYADTVATMFNPLASLNSIITERTGGEFLPFFQGPLCYGCDLCFFTNIQPMGDDTTSQAMLWIGDYGTIDGPCFFWTGGDTVQVGFFKMRMAEDTSLACHLYCPFAQGRDPENGSLLWGFSDGMNQVVPVATYGCLYIKNVSDIAGDANNDWKFNLLDILFSVSYFRGRGNPPAYYWDCPNGRFYATGDANGDCAFNAIDITYCVNYCKGFGPAPTKCSDCPQ